MRKIIKYIKWLIVPIILVSCEKEDPVTRVVEFNTTIYNALGTYDSNGKPSYLLARDNISTLLLNFIKSTLPDKVDLRKTNPDLLTTKAIADIAITKPSEVFITYVSQGGGFTNTFSFYTYPTDQPPKTTDDIKVITYVFPNSGAQTSLRAGDKVKIGNFDAGTSIGFLILQKGWDPNTKMVNNKVVHFCSNDILNPEVDPALKKHAVLIDYPLEDKVLIGFEDLDRTDPKCDHDFNDVVFYCTVKS